MGHTVLNTFVLIIYILFFLFTQQNYEWDIVRNLMKDANNFAVHDAAQETDDIEKSRGRIVFDPIQARATFDHTLQLNLGLDSEFKPKPGSRLKHPVEVVDFFYFDDSNASFPFLYENEDYAITQWIQGPAVVAVIRSNHPKFIQGGGSNAPIQVAAIYELNPNRY